MPAWRDLGGGDFGALEKYVAGLHVSREGELSGEAGLGERIYIEHCAQCHGEKGGGDGPAAGQFPIVPTNFRSERAAMGVSVRTVRNGVDGTPMAPWRGKLTEAEIVAVASFVRGFFQP
jgi:mono/diheme cytochrome c family protein